MDSGLCYCVFAFPFLQFFFPVLTISHWLCPFVCGVFCNLLVCSSWVFCLNCFQMLRPSQVSTTGVVVGLWRLAQALISNPFERVWTFQKKLHCKESFFLFNWWCICWAQAVTCICFGQERLHKAWSWSCLPSKTLRQRSFAFACSSCSCRWCSALR